MSRCIHCGARGHVIMQCPSFHEDLLKPSGGTCGRCGGEATFYPTVVRREPRQVEARLICPCCSYPRCEHRCPFVDADGVQCRARFGHATLRSLPDGMLHDCRRDDNVPCRAVLRTADRAAQTMPDRAVKSRAAEQRERDRARSRAWHARQKQLAEAFTDWRGFDGPTAVHGLYDAIWELDLPRIDKVDSLTVRMVLFAMAKHIWAPRVKKQDYTAWPGAQAIAELIDRTERQVYRVLDALVEHGLIEELHAARRPSRTRSGRPPQYRLCLERWPGRSSKQSDTGVSETPRPGGNLPPVSSSTDTGVTDSHQSDTGVTEPHSFTDTGVNRSVKALEAGKGDEKQEREAQSARENAREADLQIARDFAMQLAFPPIAVSGRPVAVERATVPLRRDCPDCRQAVGALTGKGHAAECWRFGIRASDPCFLVPRDELEAQLAAAEASS